MTSNSITSSPSRTASCEQLVTAAAQFVDRRQEALDRLPRRTRWPTSAIAGAGLRRDWLRHRQKSSARRGVPSPGLRPACGARRPFFEGTALLADEPSGEPRRRSQGPSAYPRLPAGPPACPLPQQTGCAERLEGLQLLAQSRRQRVATSHGLRLGVRGPARLALTLLERRRDHPTPSALHRRPPHQKGDLAPRGLSRRARRAAPRAPMARPGRLLGGNRGVRWRGLMS